jgi:hypothetical protein
VKVLLIAVVCCNVVIFFGIASCNTFYNDPAETRRLGDDLLPNDMAVMSVSVGECDPLGISGCYIIYYVSIDPAEYVVQFKRLADRLERRGWRPTHERLDQRTAWAVFAKDGGPSVRLEFRSEDGLESCLERDGRPCPSEISVTAQ